MNQTATAAKVLVLARPGGRAAELIEHIAPDADVREVASFEEALTALREGTFELVIADADLTQALEPAAIDGLAARILETIGQGVCIVSMDGRLVWANPKMRSYPEDLIGQVCDVAVRTFGVTSEQERGKPAHHRARRFSLSGGQDQHFEVTITPVPGRADEVAAAAAVVWDVTHSRRLQKKIDAIDLAGRELVRIDAESMGMNLEDRIRLLEQKMLRYMHDLLHFDNFAVLLIDKKTNRLEFVLQHGMTPKSRDYDIFASPENNGISGYVAATGRSYICHDTSKDPRYLPGLESARSSLTVPLRLRDQVIGVFNIESDRPAAFNEDDRQFAEILARYVAIALNILDLLITERYESTGRMVDDISGEIAAPLNDIMTEAGTLIEDYIGNDELRRKLNAICDNVTKIKSTIRDLATPRGGLLGRRETAQQDPTIQGRRILVADDEEIIRETIGNVLKKAGAQVDVACDGAQAISMLQQNSYDLLLADIRMPHKTGYEVFAAARDAQANIAVILITGFGYDPNHSIVRARKENLNAVLFKPFKVDQLLTEVRGALQGKT